MTIDETYFQNKNALMLLNEKDYKRAYDFYMWLRPYIYGDNSGILKNRFSLQVFDEANNTRVLIVNIKELSQIRPNGNIIELKKGCDWDIMITSKRISFARMTGFNNLPDKVIERQFTTFKKYALAYRIAVEKLIKKYKESIKEEK